MTQLRPFRIFLLLPAQNEKIALEEGVWSLGGEAGFVLAAQDPVRQRELDLGVLEEKGKFLEEDNRCKNQKEIFMLPVSEPPSLKTGLKKPGRGIWQFVWRVLKPELTDVATALERDPPTLDRN